MNSYLAFCVAALFVTLAPGPDTFVVIGNALRHGLRGGMATVLGIFAGGIVPILLFAGGVAQLLVWSPTAFVVVKTVGALYLVWLGIGALRSAWRPAADVDASQAGSRASSVMRLFWQGMLTTALNPKLAVFYLAFLPQFMDPAKSAAGQAVLLIGTHYVMGLLWLGFVVLAVSRVGGWLSRDSVRRSLDGIVGTVMLGFGVRLAFATR